MQFRDGALRAELVLKAIKQNGAMTLNQLYEIPEIKAVTKQKYSLNDTLSYYRGKETIFRSPIPGKDRWVYDIKRTAGEQQKAQPIDNIETPAVFTHTRAVTKEKRAYTRRVSPTNLQQVAETLPANTPVTGKPNIAVYESKMVIETDKIRIEINYG